MKFFFLLFAFCYWVLAQLCYFYDCVFCVLISVCAKQCLWEDLGWKFIWSCWKQKLLRSRDYLSFFTEECFWVDSFFRRSIDKFLTSTNLFHNFWSSISMVIFQIITDCSVSDRFCFHCIVFLFSSFYGLYFSI